MPQKPLLLPETFTQERQRTALEPLPHSQQAIMKYAAAPHPFLLGGALGFKLGGVRSFAASSEASGGNEADNMPTSAVAGRSLCLRVPVIRLIRGRLKTEEVWSVGFEPLEAVCIVDGPIARVIGLSTGSLGLLKEVRNHNSHIFCTLIYESQSVRAG